MSVIAFTVTFSLYGIAITPLPIDNETFKYSRLTEDSELILVHNIDFDRYGVMLGEEKILPFRFKSIELDKNFGKIEGSEVWALRLNSETLILPDDIKMIAAELRKINTFNVIITENALGNSIFDAHCHEICFRELKEAYCREDRLCALTVSDELLVADIRENRQTELEELVDNEEREEELLEAHIQKQRYTSFSNNSDGGFQDGEFLVEKNGLWGVYTEGTGEVVPPRYEYIKHETRGNLFNSDYLVYKSGHWGLYCAGEGEIIPPHYDGIGRYAGHIYVSLNGKTGLYTSNGRKILDAVYKSIVPGVYYGTPEYYGAVTSAGNGIIVNKYGRVLLNAGPTDRFDFDAATSGTWCNFYKGKRVGFINLKTMKVVVPCNYDPNYYLSDGQFPYRKIGVYKESQRGTLIDIWTFNGKKIASKYFPSGASKYRMKQFLENHLNISLYFE